MIGLVGVTVTVERVAEVTVNSVEPLTEPAVAVIVAWPAAVPVASPPAVMVATDGTEELQLNDAVRSWVLPSLKVPIAVNCCVIPTASNVFCGVTCTETRPGATFKLVEPVCVPKVAAMVVFPRARALACPLPLTVAIAGFEELQAAEVVRSWVVLSL